METTGKSTKQRRAKEPGATSFREKLSYAMGDMGCNFVWTFTSAFLMMYFTDSVGISAAFIGTMMMITRILDGASDIAMGIVIEKTHTRWGKARPWLLFFSLPFAISLVLLFNVPSSLAVAGKQVYMYATYIFMTVICYTVVNLAYNAMLPRFSLTPHDRNVVSAVRGVVVIITALAINIATPILIGMLGGQQNQQSWKIVSIAYAAISLVMLMITFFGVKEKISPKTDANGKIEKVHIPSALKILLKNKYFYIATVLFVLFYAINGMGAVTVYYARDILGDFQLYSLIASIMILPMLVGIPMMPALYKKFGKRNVMLVGALVSAAGCALQLISPANLTMYIAFSIIRGFGSIMFSASIFTLASDIVEFSEWKHGIRTEGLVTSVNSFGMKVGTGVGAGLVGWVLALGGYNPAAEMQSLSSLQSMIALQLVIPMVFSLLLAVLLIFWDIDKFRPQIEKALGKRTQDAGEAA